MRADQSISIELGPVTCTGVRAHDDKSVDFGGTGLRGPFLSHILPTMSLTLVYKIVRIILHGGTDPR
jgi:hypothetical protein